MITFVRTRAIAPGKMAEAMAHAEQVAKLVKDKHGVQLRLNVPFGGNPDRIAFVSSHASLGEVEALGVALRAVSALTTFGGTKGNGTSSIEAIWRTSAAVIRLLI